MENSNEKYTYTTMTREAGSPSFTFAEVKYGKIVSINQHWVPLKEYIKFFEADSLFIDITGVLINGESPAIGDSVTSAADGYKIIHLKSTYSVAEAKGYVVEKLKLVRNQKELAPIEYKTHLFDADKDSLMRLDKARQSLEDNKLADIEWTTAKNERIRVFSESPFSISLYIFNSFESSNSLFCLAKTSSNFLYLIFFSL